MSSEVTALSFLAQAWLKRQIAARDTNEGTPDALSARSLFLLGGQTLVQAGLVRESFPAFVEAEALTEWLRRTGTDVRNESDEDKNAYRILSKLPVEVDEPHLANRLNLIQIIAGGLRTSFGEATLIELEEIKAKANKFRDQRTYCHALIVEFYVNHQLGYPADSAIYDRVASMLRKNYGSAAENYPREFINRSLYDDPYVLLLF